MQCAVFYWFVSVVSVCLVASIEVHESPNEENTTTDSGMLKSTLPNSAVVGSGANNGPGKQQVTASGTPASTTNNNNNNNNGGNSEDYTIVPSNHKPATDSNNNNKNHKHSPSYRDAPLSITPTASSVALSSSSSTSSSSSQTSSAVATQSSSSSGSSSKNSGASKDVVGGSNLVQHQISGYKKRQLYAGSYQQLSKNATNDRSYDKDNQPASKEFVPSPELVPYYPTEDHQHHHHHHHSHQYQPQQVIHQVDAPYPATVSSDSKWFGGNFAPGGPVDNELRSGAKPAGPGWPSTANKWEQHPKSGKLLWLPNSNGGAEQDSPFSRPAKPKLSPPKGKWKWVPVEEGDASDGLGDDSLQQGEKGPADLESKIVAGHHHFYKFPPREHPYSFDGGEGAVVTAGQSPFSGGGSTSDEASAGNTASNPLDFFYSTAFGEAGGSTKLKTGGKGGDDSLKKGVSPWKKIIHVLTAAIPIGLIISALTPQVVYVNPNMTLPPVQMQTPTPISATGGSFTNPTRQRSEDQLDGGNNPLVGFINALSEVANPISERWPSSTGCEERSFCEMARLGMNNGADALLRMLWKTANETPTDRAHQSGLEEIFRAVRDDDCSRFHCEAT